jgi:hypothetical protein
LLKAKSKKSLTLRLLALTELRKLKVLSTSQIVFGLMMVDWQLDLQMRVSEIAALALMGRIPFDIFESS